MSNFLDIDEKLEKVKKLIQEQAEMEAALIRTQDILNFIKSPYKEGEDTRLIEFGISDKQIRIKAYDVIYTLEQHQKDIKHDFDTITFEIKSMLK